MADILILSRLIDGAIKNINISSNTLVTTSVKVGGSVSNTELTKAILDNLVALQGGGDFANGTNAHTHDGRYFTEVELASTGATSGASRIGVNLSPTNYTAALANVESHLAGINSALGALTFNSFSDALFEIYDNADATKLLKFQLSGIGTGQTRTITMPNADVDLGKVATAIQRDGSVAATANLPMGGFKLTGLAAGSGAGDSVRYEQAILASGANAFAAAQSMGGFKLTNVADPTTAQDAATKAYVDAVQQGIKPKAAVRVATTANIDLSSMPASIDGVSLSSNDRIMVKNQTAAEDNGIYVFNGAASAATRATDFDSLTPIDEVNGAYAFIREGTQAGQGWTVGATVTTLDTDPINFVYFNDATTAIGGDMVTVVGSTISVDLAAVSGLESSNPGNSAGQLRIKLEASNPTLKIDGSNQLGIKLDAAGAIVTGASGVAVAVDGSSIEISSNAIRIKAVGVQASHVNTNVFDQNTIAGGAGTAAAVQHAPLVKQTLVAGESFAANTSFLVRWAITGETAGRVYKADRDASTSAKYMAIGIALSTSAISAGQDIPVFMLGSHVLGSSDVLFNAADVGKELFVGTAGAIILGSSLTNNVNEAAACIGTIQATNRIWVGGMAQLRGIS